MARKKGAKGAASSEGVRQVEIGGRQLVTWDLAEPAPAIDRGAIVRLKPHHDTPDGAVEAARVSCERAGAIRVTLLPKPIGEVVPNAAKPASSEAPRGAREAVLELIEESASKDKARLRAFCEQVMAEQGL